MNVNNLRMSFPERVQRCIKDDDWWDEYKTQKSWQKKDFSDLSFEDYIEGMVWQGADLDEDEQELWQKNPVYWKEEPLEGCALF